MLVLPSDAGTWSATIVTSARDHALRPLYEEANYRKLLAACPMHAVVLGLEPITGMIAAAGISDRLRRLTTGAEPVATGVLTVGGSWPCTNPSLGRGVAIGLMHALATAEAVAEHADDPVGLALAHDRLTIERVLP